MRTQHIPATPDAFGLPAHHPIFGSEHICDTATESRLASAFAQVAVSQKSSQE
jgi:hypothetical protein